MLRGNLKSNTMFFNVDAALVVCDVVWKGIRLFVAVNTGARRNFSSEKTWDRPLLYLS